jgi:ribosome-binding protein aMBF1 (putative translation factor)
MDADENGWISPIGQTITESIEENMRESAEYREAAAEYAAIKELRKQNWIAAHVRERRYELELTEEEVAEKARTSPSIVTEVERGELIPTIPVLQSILAVLEDELLIAIQPQEDGEEFRQIGPVPDISAA